MAVQVQDQNFGIDGHAKSLQQFRRSHHENADALITHAENLHREKAGQAPIPVDTPRPAYDPNHPDNQWPVMVHHSAKGELTVGRSLKGMPNATNEDRKAREAVERQNNADLRAAITAGYRKEPYAKPQISVLDPAAEKAALKRELDEKQGHINALNDATVKLLARVEQLEAAQGASPKA